MGRRTTAAALCAALCAACGPGDRESPTSGAPDAAAAGGSDAREFADAGPPPAARMYVHSRDTLYVIDDDNFDLVEVGPLGMPPEIGLTDLAVTPDGSLYGISGGALYRIDAATGEATDVADVPGVLNVGLTFLPDGRLLATDKEGGVRRIDPATGAVEEVGAFGGGYATAGDLVAVADGTMYAISDEGPSGNEAQSNVLLVVDPDTGQSVDAVGQIGYGGVFGCAYANGKVYAFTQGGEVIEIDRTTGAGSFVRDFQDMSFWGAAVSPLVIVD